VKWARACFLVLLVGTARAHVPDARPPRDVSASWAKYYAAVYQVPVELVAAIIDEEIRAIINHGYQTAKGILLAQRTKMDAIVEQLKIVETLDARELDEIIAREQPQAPAASSSAS